MANYSTLKAAVADVVKTNGTQAITGANLQTVLLSIINSVGGGGYIFKGVATPSTDAGTPDENVFYIGGAGTYANFGTSVTIPVGSICVFKYNGSWVKEQIAIYALDNAPTKSSPNLVTSGAVFDDTKNVERFPVSNSPIHNAIIKEMIIYDDNYNGDDITIGYIDRKYSGNDKWFLRLDKGGSLYFQWSSSSYDEPLIFDQTYNGIRIRAIIDWNKMTIGQRIGYYSDAIVNKTCFIPMYSPTLYGIDNDVVLDKKIDDLNGEIPPFSQRTVLPWFLNTTTPNTDNNCGAVVIEVKGGESVSMTATSYISYYYVTKTLPILGVANVWATGYSTRSSLLANNSTTFTLPSDARYLTISTLWFGNDNKPVKLVIGGVDYIVGRDGIFERVNDIETEVKPYPTRFYQSTGLPPDKNTNFTWYRQRLYGGNSVDFDAFIQLFNGASAVRVPNTSFVSEWFGGHQVNVTYDSNSQFMLKQRIFSGTIPSNKKYKFVVEIKVTGTITQSIVYLGADAYSTQAPMFIGTNKEGILIHEFVSADVVTGTDVWLRMWGNAGTVVSIGRVSLIEVDADKDYQVPYYPLVATTDVNTEIQIHNLSPYTGKKFYSLGDSITAQRKWQPLLAQLFQMDFIVWSETYPLGVGGAMLCPFVPVVTTNEGDSNKVLDGNGNQVQDGNGNPLWFKTGKKPYDSIYYRANYFATQYTDAEVIVIDGGQNDDTPYSYPSVGEPSDTPYEGKPYVNTAYAVVAKYYDVAIYDDGTLDRTEYPPSTYTIITEKPTLSAVVGGIVKKICTALPSARVVACSIMRYNRPLSQETERRVAQKNGILAAFNYYGIPTVNLWDEMGVNTYNFTQYYVDDVHPSVLGGERMAAIIAQTL